MKSTKKSLLTYIIITLVGIVGILYAFLFLARDNYQSGLIYGLTGGFVLTGIAGILYSLYLKRNPKRAKEVDLQQNEERTQFIRMKTASSSNQVILYSECIACLVSGLLGYKEISITLALVLVVQLIVSYGFSAYYCKKY